MKRLHAVASCALPLVCAGPHARRIKGDADLPKLLTSVLPVPDEQYMEDKPVATVPEEFTDPDVSPPATLLARLLFVGFLGSTVCMLSLLAKVQSVVQILT